jgi:hypothetical protein
VKAETESPTKTKGIFLRLRGKQLCPYSVMCQDGPGHSLMAGYRQVDFSGKGEQYASANIHVHNVWVVVGAKDRNRLTPFMLHE